MVLSCSITEPAPAGGRPLGGPKLRGDPSAKSFGLEKPIANRGCALPDLAGIALRAVEVPRYHIVGAFLTVSLF